MIRSNSSISIYDKLKSLTNRIINDVKRNHEDFSIPNHDIGFDREALNTLFENAPNVAFIYNSASFSYDYFSPNVSSILGYTEEDFSKGGMKFAMSCVMPSHSNIYNTKILPLMFKYYFIYSIKRKIKDLKIGYLFKFRRKDGQYIWAQHFMTVIETNKIGMPNKILVTLSDVSNLKKDNLIDVVVQVKNTVGIYETLYQREYSIEEKTVIYSDREIEILKLLQQGKTSKVIANELCISEHTVKTHRKNILRKKDSNGFLVSVN